MSIHAGRWVAQLCATYGWTVQYVLSMPITQFFLMLDQSMIIRALHYSELCDIQAIGLCKIEYFKELKEKYQNVIHGKTNEEPEWTPKPKTKEYVDSASPEAKNAIFRMLSIVKQGT